MSCLLSFQNRGLDRACCGLCERLAMSESEIVLIQSEREGCGRSLP